MRISTASNFRGLPRKSRTREVANGLWRGGLAVGVQNFGKSKESGKVHSMNKGVSELEAKAKEVEEGQVDTLDTPARYLAFGARLRPIVQPLTRYLAYTSDVGESFRPVVAPKIVTAAYGVSWAYLIGDTGYEGYKARLRAQELCPESETQVVGLTVIKRGLFQTIASMLFPALTIHSVVKYSARAISRSNIKNVRIKAWGPTMLGLGVVPALPYLFDEPVEKAIDKGFDVIEERLYANQPKIRQALAGHVPKDHKEI